MTFTHRVQADWLEAFVEYGGYGEASPRLLYWVGVSTIAAVLQRKTWIDLKQFQWSPNFYILLVGEPGVIRKSTSIDIGMKLLRQVAGVKLGASSSTWQAFVQRLGNAYARVEVVDEDGVITPFESSSMTLPLSEFGTFFDPEDRALVDVLTDLWDGRLDTFEKDTKTNGSDTIINPWINIIAATTPRWIARNFGDSLVGTGFASRLIVLTEEMPIKDVAYPHRGMPPDIEQRGAALVARLTELAGFAGQVDLTEEAYAWGEQWYASERAALRATGFGTIEADFVVRKQGHLHKLATVISAARNALPRIEVEHLIEADTRLRSMEADTRRVFGVVGQSKLTSAAREIVDAVARAGPAGIERRVLYRRQFFRTMTSDEYDAAVRSAVQAELVLEADNVACPVLILRKR